MAWNTSSSFCECDWEAGFGTNDCDAQTPGADTTMVAVCMSDLASVTKTAPAAANPDTTGVITAVTLNSGKQGQIIKAKKDSVDVNTSEAINDNGGQDVDESVVGNAPISTTVFNYMRAHIGKETALFFCDNDQKLWCMGHAGGLELSQWAAAWGVQQGDAKQTNFTFANTSKPGLMEVQVADVNAFFTQITTPAP